MLLTVIVFIIILGILVFVHELGHFVVARRNGIKTEEFGFGFPPRIVGVQFLKGKENKKISEIESIEVKTTDIKVGQDEIIQETITEKMHTVEKTVPVKKWRIVWGRDGDDENEKQSLREMNKKKFLGGTIYSLNWFPIGGFVKIKGENGEDKKDQDSFASKSPWVRIKVLAAGVTMNFILAYILFALLLTMGVNEEIDQNDASQVAKIQIASVATKTPAYEMGIREGDTIIGCVGQDQRCGQNFSNIVELQSYVDDNKGKQITLRVNRGEKNLDFIGTPRIEIPEGEGALGIGLVQTKFVKYSWLEALAKAPIIMWNVLLMMGVVIKNLFAGDFSNVGGPFAIAHYTKQATALGLGSIIQLMALLSVNLGIINILPFPALDGGRILFILIEKIKGKPVSQNFESITHTIGFFILMSLMAYLVVQDIMRYGMGGIF